MGSEVRLVLGSEEVAADSRLKVDCDEDCGALDEPETLEEHLASLAHWKNHGFLSGCSHGC